MIHPIIMAGGKGSRLWPISRELYPKQFLTFSDSFSMLQQTFDRLSGIKHHPPILICNEDHRFIAAEQVRSAGFNHSGIILESVGKNTAPAITLAALQVLKQENDLDPILLVLAADHFIKDVSAFEESISKALPYAEDGQLVAFGIVPTTAETGYGYIKAGEPKDRGHNGFFVHAFVEKPDLITAQKYLASGDYYWNSGIFMFKASQYLEMLKLHSPDILLACEQAMLGSTVDMDFIRVDKIEFGKCPENSIDYAIMEPLCSAHGASDVVVVPIDAGWSDVGSWSALWEVSDKDSNDNVMKGDVIAVNSRGNYLHSENKLVATVGVDNLVVVETKDAILVADMDQVQDVKSIVNHLKSKNRTEHKLHREVYRPWGMYDSIDSGERFQVKRITVKPGAKLSVQMHHHRAEHWIVVSGTAKVTIGEKDVLLTENQSIYIPIGAIHALENPGKVDLEIIEVQSGSYLGEDDIVRFEDRYGRVEGK